jgi:putative GTP pyrophosphokinase
MALAPPVASALLAWLDLSSRTNAAYAAIATMAKKPVARPWVSKGRINKAGEALRRRKLEPDDVKVLEEWRHAHTYVINTFQALLRQRARRKDIEVAQRLKRRATIIDKLINRQTGMELARMDDIAGCRMIFDDIEQLYAFRESLHEARFKHVRRNDTDKYDYIKNPSVLGYRGVHDVYEYRVRGKKNSVYNGLLIELQYRTYPQHAWATSVELITDLTEHEPKFNRGSANYVELFKLASEIVARTEESRKSCHTTLGDKEVVERLRTIEAEIDVLLFLANLEVHKWVYDEHTGKNVILQIPEGGELQVHSYDTELEASAALFELERKHPEDNIVLVGADTAAEVASAFRNYFADAREFLRMIEAGCNKLAGKGFRD